MVLDGLVTTGINYVLAYGFVGIFVFAFLETSMLFPYLPAEVVVPLAAVALVTGPLSFGVFVIATTVGGTLGALVAYSVSVKGGRLAKTRLQNYIELSAKKHRRADRWYEKWGEPSVIWGRYLPALRSVVSIPAGIAGMSPWKFTIYTAIGNGGFYSSVAIVVYYTETKSLQSIGFSLIQGSFNYLLGLISILFLTLLAWKVTERSFD